jgi:hypothetical protein
MMGNIVLVWRSVRRMCVCRGRILVKRVTQTGLLAVMKQRGIA